MNIFVGIQTTSKKRHPERWENALKLWRDLTWHNETRLVDDAELRGPWYGARDFWAGTKPQFRKSIEYTHALLLQDDCDLVPNFSSHLLRIANAQPGSVISLYRGWRSPTKPPAGSFFATNIKTNGPAIMMPLFLAPEFVAWCDEFISPDYKSYDSRLILWLRATGRALLYAEPNLVQHKQDLESAMAKGTNKGRFSRNFDPDLDLSVKWDGPIIANIVPPDVRLTAEHKAIYKHKMPEFERAIGRTK